MNDEIVPNHVRGCCKDRLRPLRLPKAAVKPSTRRFLRAVPLAYFASALFGRRPHHRSTINVLRPASTFVLRNSASAGARPIPASDYAAAFDQEVRLTYLHELGHYLGLDESDLEKRGLE